MHYFIVDGTDYKQKTATLNLISDEALTARTIVVCYNQIIYDDQRVELAEYTGLSMDISQASTKTLIQPLHKHSAIQIVDDDSKLYMLI